jgi:hypothetical protein
MPLKLDNGEWLKPASEWKTVTVSEEILKKGPRPDKNFYVTTKKS